ncbi:MAG: Asp23/Gls24 family envelope stress response protein [Candidatus Omnitrophica bacterium]|nr:Asp23/Gls24 family envelope stress response protein [Candidatus Omnitrophota bacterium]
MDFPEAKMELGLVKIHKSVISSIASLAAMEVEGVKKIGKNNVFGELLKGKPYRNIKVIIDKNGEIKLNIPLIIKYGFNIPEVALQVQNNVRLALQNMVNLEAKEINIDIKGIERS